MIKKKEFYNPELETTELYTEIWEPELIEVRDISDLLVVNHYWQDAEGELWGDFNDPMENVRNGFDAYRKRKGYMMPNEIQNLRNKLGMTVREFANTLGIGSSTLTQIENNKRLQVKYQENLFQAVKNQYKNGKIFFQAEKESDEGLLTDILRNSSYQTNDLLYNTGSVNKNTQTFNKFGDLGDAA